MRPKRTSIHRSATPAFILIDLAVALTVCGLLVGGLLMTVSNYAKARRYYALHQTVAWAADAQLQRILAGAEPDSQPPGGTIRSDIVLSASVTPGIDAWQGMELVAVTASIHPKHWKPIRVESRAYRRSTP